MKIFNLNSDVWDGTRDRDGWRVKGALVGHRIGGQLIGATMSEVEPGDKLWPYHTHYLNEEWVIVLRGEPTLRTPAGEQVLKEGDVSREIQLRLSARRLTRQRLSDESSVACQSLLLGARLRCGRSRLPRKES